MRNRLPLTPLAITLGMLTPALGRAQVTLVETVDYVPTSVVALPRTYVLPSAYVTTSTALVAAPTTTVYGVRPTSYYASSYYVPTSYYYRRPFWRNRYVATSYLYEPTVYVSPTYYVAPTTYVASSAVTTSSLCCETAAPVVRTPARSSQVYVEPTTPRSPGGAIESSAVGEPDDQVETTGSSGLRPIAPNGAARGSGAVGTSSAVGASPGAVNGSSAAPNRASGATSPNAGTNPTADAARESRAVPPVPVPSGNTGTSGASPGGAVKPPLGTGDSTSPPARTEPDLPMPTPIPSPAGDNPLGLPSMEDPVRRSANKPIPAIGAPRILVQNILRGRIVSADTRLPETGVQVILVDRLGRFADRTTRTDATGRFALALPEGDWTILLTMPSGRALPVEQGLVTASAGKVSDRWGRELTNLVISR